MNNDALNVFCSPWNSSEFRPVPFRKFHVRTFELFNKVYTSITEICLNTATLQTKIQTVTELAKKPLCVHCG